MLYFFSGTDRKKAYAAADAAIRKSSKNSPHVVRITDAHAPADLAAVLGGGGMFGEERTVVLDGVCANEEMRSAFFAAMPDMAKSKETFFVLEGKLDALTRKGIEKYAETVERFDTRKEKEGGEIFALARALRRGDKKALWVGYQRALLRDEAPEAIHGVLFWGAKEMFMQSRGADRTRAEKFLAELAELPHEARRKGFALEYALERYILGLPRRAP